MVNQRPMEQKSITNWTYEFTIMGFLRIARVRIVKGKIFLFLYQLQNIVHYKC